MELINNMLTKRFSMSSGKANPIYMAVAEDTLNKVEQPKTEFNEKS